MASIFPKADPKDKSIKRWMAKVKVGDQWITVSLRLLANGNKREAQARANDLQAELKAQLISEASRAWLGDQTFIRLSTLAGRAGAKVTAGSPECWQSALTAYLKATNAKDTRTVVEGKVKAEEKTKVSRRTKLGLFVKWTQANKIPFLKVPFTQTVIAYINHRKSQGIRSNTLWSGDYTMLCCWGEWMAKRSICEVPNRDLIREVMPEKEVPVVVVPTWQEDLDTLRFWYGKRLTDASKSPQWKRLRTYWPLWMLVLVVRGLGCRPSEATALSWATVDLASQTVRFVRSKNKKNRRVPILFQWVRAGLEEAWERAGRPKEGPVCTTWDGSIWKNDCSASNRMQELCDHHERPVYHLKKAQKLFIAHAIRLGFPPHVVAHWTDHSLTVQEKHYYEGDGYLPPEDGWDYAEFGKLSEYGFKVRQHTSSYSSDPEVR